jgi:hypothetical protein
MNLIFLNNIVPNKSIKVPIDSTKQVEEILKTIENKVKKEDILKMTLYYIDRDCYDNIYLISEAWKPANLEIEYIGNYMNYNPLIHVMASVIAEPTKVQTIQMNNVNYII